MTKAALLCGKPTAAVELHRGMILTSLDRKQAGKVAGIAISRDNYQVICLIVCHLPKERGYQSLPASWIERVEEEVVFLNVNLEKVRALPAWHFT
jgi:hypothetical protein